MKEDDIEKQNKIFYVYEWYNVDTREVFYVGKGSKKRYKTVEGRNTYFQNYYGKHDCEVRIVKRKLSEEVAYKFEEELIAKYKERGECVCNFHKGGLGGASNANSPDDTVTLRKISSYVNRSYELIGSKGREIFCPLSNKKERALIGAFQEFGLYTSEDYYELERDEKLDVANRVLEFLEEEYYNDEVYELVEEGAYGSFDEFWEHLYKD